MSEPALTIGAAFSPPELDELLEEDELLLEELLLEDDVLLLEELLLEDDVLLLEESLFEDCPPDPPHDNNDKLKVIAIR